MTILLAAARPTRFEIADESMLPALHPGDYLIAVRRRATRRGDIVIYAHPTRPDLHVVKRVVGLPGERVTIGAGRVEIDGSIQMDRWSAGVTYGSGTWQLGGAEVFVLGDNRAVSAADGRELGPLPLPRIPWHAVFRYWPPSTAGTLR